MEDTAETIQTPMRMEDTALRRKIREYARQQRKELRTNSMDALRFCLGQIQDEIRELECLDVKDVRGLASRIKRRKHADAADMYRLSHAFLQGNANIIVFAGVQGATQVIVKELTGGHVQRQIEAAECLCNLSLGKPYVCEKITNLAGSYLVTYLTSQEPRLKRSCLWTLANILASCRKSAKMLLQMQLATKLWKLYTATDAPDYQEDAGICLYLIAMHAPSEVTTEDRRYIAEHLQEKQPTEPGADYFMYIVFQLDIVGLDSDLICASHYQHFFHFFTANVELDYNTPNGKLRILYGVHVLANIFATSCPALDALHLDAANFAYALNKLFGFKNESLTLELLRLLANLMHLQLVDNEQLLEQVRIYDCPVRA
ncbi:hypothetical protein ACLKA6_012368 [Drosophila palustris]